MCREAERERERHIRTYVQTYMHACIHTYIHTLMMRSVSLLRAFSMLAWAPGQALIVEGCDPNNQAPWRISPSKKLARKVLVEGLAVPHDVVDAVAITGAA